MHRVKNIFLNISRSELVINSLYGIIANILQTLFTSLLFIILARNYNTKDFAEFLLATTVYQLIVAFSTMGLGQWFIREYASNTDKVTLISKFLKIQIGLGFLFYLTSIGLAFALYPEGQIRLLSVILGTNIIFDNVIQAIRSLNIAENKQRKSATILAIDGFLKLAIGCFLYIYPFSIIYLSCFLIIVRFLTLNLFINIGGLQNISFGLLLNTKVSLTDFKRLVLLNWRFVVIGSVSVIYWRIAHIIISKTLSLQDVASYEIAFRIFSLTLILPIIASTTIFPKFVKFYNEKDFECLKQLYNKIFLLYTLFSLIFYAFIMSFADILIPFAFGNEYLNSVTCVKQMFLTVLLFPTVLLQANLIIALQLERKDMQFNVYSLIINIVGCFLGLYFYKSLAVINYSIFISIIAFHIFQNALLIKKRIASYKSSFLFYAIIAAFILIYKYSSDNFDPYLVFLSFCSLILVCIIIFLGKNNRIELNSISRNNVQKSTPSL